VEGGTSSLVSGGNHQKKQKRIKIEVSTERVQPPSPGKRRKKEVTRGGGVSENTLDASSRNLSSRQAKGKVGEPKGLIVFRKGETKTGAQWWIFRLETARGFYSPESTHSDHARGGGKKD